MSTVPYPERRRHRRLDLALPIRFSTRAPGGPSRHGRGFTVDISSGWVRFETDLAEPPAPQSDVAIYITIPRHAENQRSAVFISGNAAVVRCEPLDAATRHHTPARWAVAARFETHPDISLPIVEDFTPGTG